MDLNELKKQQEAAAEGIWVEYGDMEFKIRSTTSKEYRKAVMKNSKGKTAHTLKRLEVLDQVGIKTMAEGLLLDWKGLTEGGEPLPCTLENRIRLLTISPAIRDFLADCAADHASFESEAAQEEAETFRSSSKMGSAVGADGRGSAAEG